MNPVPIPRAALAQHVIALGKTGSGKSSKLRVIVEHLLAQHDPVTIIDPKGDWWGLKSSADGKSAGYPIVIFGGEHADVPINEHSGAHVAELVGGDVIYPHRPDLAGRKFWLCRPCRAYVGTHRNSRQHAPLGRLANAELRQLKQQVHAAFDPRWKSGAMKRSAAYASLAAALGIEQRECHIGMFDEDRCRRALVAIEATAVSATHAQEQK